VALLNPPDVVPEAMRFLIRTLLAYPDARCDKDELLSLVAPEGLVEAMASIGARADSGNDDGDDTKTGGRTIASASFDALRLVGLVTTERSSIVATEATTTQWRKPTDVTAQAFGKALRRTVWTMADGTAPAGDTQGATDLVQALALLAAAPNPLEPFDGFDQKNGRRFVDYQKLLLGEEKSTWPVPNKEQWLPFRRIAPYLGLARPVGASRLAADSSVALGDELASLAPGRYDIASFVAHCVTAIPFFDGGPLEWKVDRNQEDMSPGLSLTLRQLEADGHLKFDLESDIATSVVALGGDSGLRVNISHVEWRGAVPNRKRVS
jgi:hypothetical protein